MGNVHKRQVLSYFLKFRVLNPFNYVLLFSNRLQSAILNESLQLFLADEETTCWKVGWSIGLCTAIDCLFLYLFPLPAEIEHLCVTLQDYASKDCT